MRRRRKRQDGRTPKQVWGWRPARNALADKSPTRQSRYGDGAPPVAQEGCSKAGRTPPRRVGGRHSGGGVRNGLLVGETGQITLEYVLLLAAVILPLVGVVYLLWEILMYFYWNTALVVSIPYL